MLLKLLGWFWVVTGVLFLFYPDRLRNKLKKKSVKKLKRLFFGAALALGILLISSTWGMPGFLPKLIMILGIIGILKAFFFLKAKAADHLIEWFVSQPIKFFRIWAVVQIFFGAVLLSI